MIYNPPPTSQFLTTAAMSNHSHGNPALFLTNLSGTTASNSAGLTLSLSAGAGGPGGGGPAISGGANSQSTGTVNFSQANGVTFGLETNGVMTASVQTNYQAPGAYLTTAALSNHSHGVSFTSGSTVFQTLSFTNSNGISFNSGTQGIFGSHNGITTARASNDAIGLNTAQTNVTWTVNSSGISINAGAYLTTAALSNHSHGNPTLALTNLSGTTASASNGFTLSLSAAAPGGGGAINVIAGTTDGNLQTISFSNGSGVTFGLNGSTLTASVNAGGGGATISTYHNHPINILTTMSGPSNVSATIQFLPMREALTATRVEIPVSVNVATAINNSSGAILYTLSAYLYTKNGATLNSVSSGSGAATHTWSSNATGSVTGGRFISAAMNVNATAGNYFIGLHLSTRATGHAGPGSTSLGNTLSMLGVGTAMAGAITFGDFGAATAASAGWYTVGMNSSTGNLTQVSLSNVTQAGSGFQRADIALRMYL